MDRLRDRWWDAVSSRRSRTNMLLELQEVLPSSRGQEPSSDDESVYSIETTTQKEETLIPKQQSISALQSLLQEMTTTSVIDLLHRCIRQEDSQALQEWVALHLQKEQDISSHIVQSILLVIMELIHQDKPDLLRIILQHYTINKTASSSSTHDTNSPLHLAAILGREECMTLILTKQDHAMALLHAHDQRGDNVFHTCCRGSGDESILRRLFRFVSGNKNKKTATSAAVQIAPIP